MLPPTFRTAMNALRRNKMRSFLTALGVIIGVGAVIAMMEIGNGSKAAIEKTIASMGANNILVLPGAAATGGVSFGVGSVMTLTPQDVDEIARQCPAVSDAAPMVRARPQIVYLHSNWIPNSFIGTTPSFLAVRDWEDLSEGDIFTDLDVRNQNKVCLVGETLKRELFQGESPVGKEIRIQNVTFKVIGVLSRKGRQHDGHGPGRRGDRPLDDGQIPPQRQQRRVAQRVHLRLVDRHQHGEQPLSHRHGDLSRHVGDRKRPTRRSRSAW